MSNPANCSWEKDAPDSTCRPNCSTALKIASAAGKLFAADKKPWPYDSRSPANWQRKLFYCTPAVNAATIRAASGSIPEASSAADSASADSSEYALAWSRLPAVCNA